VCAQQCRGGHCDAISTHKTGLSTNVVACAVETTVSSAIDSAFVAVSSLAIAAAASCKNTPLCSQLFLCVSRACLGNVISFSTKWRQ
jgi:hypothetical protein